MRIVSVIALKTRSNTRSDPFASGFWGALRLWPRPAPEFHSVTAQWRILRRDHDRGSAIYGCGIIYMHLLRFVVARASLLLLRCAPAHRRIRVPTPRRHVAVPPSAHTSTGICGALSHHHATGPVHQCSPGARFCDRLPFKSHSAPRPPQTPAASS